MSYILDALKKNQPGNEGNPVHIDSTVSRSGVSAVWVWVLGAALAINAVALGWFMLQSTPSTEPGAIPLSADRNTPAMKPSTQPMPRSTPPASQQATRQPPPAQASARPIVDPKTQPQQIKQTTATISKPSPTPQQRNSTTQIETVRLNELPADEREIFTNLSFTSHIFTDDPALCAVVIDGQRLRNGGQFGALKIHKITEFGVVFEQRHQGRLRRVELNPFE